MIHTGSRGLGYQVCDDSLVEMQKAVKKYAITLPDRQLACAPVTSPEGQQYLAAMAAAANYAWANRQAITALDARGLRESLRNRRPQTRPRPHLRRRPQRREVRGPRSGRESAKTLRPPQRRHPRLPPGHPDLSPLHQKTGQPVIVPGDMGRASYLLVGTERAMKETWGSTCHGAGRMMSRHAATKAAKGRNIAKELEAVGVYARAASREGLVEEMPEAYKDVNDVVEVCHGAGISKLVVRLRPMGVMKG